MLKTCAHLAIYMLPITALNTYLRKVKKKGKKKATTTTAARE
jgi:hypothetical protein